MDVEDVLGEQKNNDTVTIRQIREIASQGREVFIKPAGRRTYYTGTMNDIPNTLLDIPILEITTQAFYEDDIHAIKRYYAKLGFWINPIPEWDKQIDEKDSSSNNHSNEITEFRV